MIAKFPFRHIAATVCILGLSSCDFVKNSDVGKVTGPIGGSVNGSEVSGAPRDTVALGGLLRQLNGDKVAAALNEEDLHLMGTMAFIVLDQVADDKTRTWRNKRTRHHGSFNASTTWKTSDNIQCRRFTNLIYVEDNESRSIGTACRMRNGLWTVTG